MADYGGEGFGLFGRRLLFYLFQGAKKGDSIKWPNEHGANCKYLFFLQLFVLARKVQSRYPLTTIAFYGDF
jgi:hypothetical protein